MSGRRGREFEVELGGLDEGTPHREVVRLVGPG